MSILSYLWPSKVDKPGVYRIRNTITGCEYIGGTTRTFRLRWNQHTANLRFNRHDNKKMQADWNKYGESAFEFSVIEVVKDKSAVFDREIHWQNRGFSVEGRYNPSNDRTKPVYVRQKLSPELQGFAERFAALTDDERLEMFALARNPDGSWRFREDRIARFIGGKVNARLNQVRRVRDNGHERLIAKYGK